MIELVATAESVKQAKALIDSGVDTLYIGNDDFGLRLPKSFSNDELEEITTYAHTHGKKVHVAVNVLMHNEHIKRALPYLQFLTKIQVDAIVVGDPGIIQLLKKNKLSLPYIYDAQTMVTSANQVNFWVKRGAIGAVMARELTFTELAEIRPQVSVPIEILVYGPTCIHQSKRPLVENYFDYTSADQPTNKKDTLFLSEAKKEETHYSIYQDSNGTHVFATDDVNLLPHADELHEEKLTEWKLDGLFTKGEDFIAIAKVFIKAKQAFKNNEMTPALLHELNEQLLTHHPKHRGLSTGFYSKDPSDVK